MSILEGGSLSLRSTKLEPYNESLVSKICAFLSQHLGSKFQWFTTTNLLSHIINPF